MSESAYATGAEAYAHTLECIGKHQHGEIVAVEVAGRGVIGASKEPAVVASLLRSHLCFDTPRW